jgi:hypothetical protein
MYICSTSRNGAGLIPDEAIGLLNLRNISSRTVALGLTQPLTEISALNISRGKKRPDGWQPHLHLWADRLDQGWPT